MHIKPLLIVLFAFASTASFGQNKSDIFNRNADITWLGLDFTGAKLIGDRERLGSESDIKHLINSWNEIFLKEPNKFDVALAIDKIKVTNAIEITTEHNEELDALSLYSDQQKDYLHLRPNQVEDIVASYDFKDLSGIGLMFNVESFSKTNNEASVWVTFINLNTKEVYFTERITGEPGGAGLKNYWANACYDILKKVKKKEFEMWRKKYYRP